MKFQLIVRVFVIFSTHTILRTSKSIGNNTMKKMLLATALALLITGCAQQTFAVQNKPAAVAQRKPSPIISSFLELGEENCRCSQFCGGAENVKTETQQTFVNGLSVYYFRHLYSAGSALCIAHNNCMSCPSIWATLSTAR